MIRSSHWNPVLLIVFALPMVLLSHSAWADDMEHSDPGISSAGKLNLLVKGPFGQRYSIDLKYANYNSRNFAMDTEKLWIMLSARFGN